MLAEFERLTGVRPFASRNWVEVIHPEDRARVLAEWESAQRAGRFCAEYRLRFADGVYRYVRGASRRVRCILRDKWLGYIRPIDKDHAHRCESAKCYCIASRIQ